MIKERFCILYGFACEMDLSDHLFSILGQITCGEEIPGCGDTSISH